MTLHFQIDWKDVLVVNQDKMASIFWKLEKKKKDAEPQYEVLTAFLTRAPHNLRIENTRIFLLSRMAGDVWFVVHAAELYRLPPVTWSSYSNSEAFSENAPSPKKWGMIIFTSSNLRLNALWLCSRGMRAGGAQLCLFKFGREQEGCLCLALKSINTVLKMWGKKHAFKNVHHQSITWWLYTSLLNFWVIKLLWFNVTFK